MKEVKNNPTATMGNEVELSAERRVGQRWFEDAGSQLGFQAGLASR
jgi:hypothetical protein